jgi:hypothetical protein
MGGGRMSWYVTVTLDGAHARHVLSDSRCQQPLWKGVAGTALREGGTVSAFSGRQHRGAMRELRLEKRKDAEERASNVKLENTRQYRLAPPLLQEIAQMERDKSNERNDSKPS